MEFLFTNNIQIREKYLKRKKICELSLNEFYEVIDNDTNSLYTARIPVKNINELSNDNLIRLSQEINIISRLYHPSILNFISYSPVDFENQSKPVIITEQMCNMTLNEVLLTDKKKLQEMKFSYAKKIVIIYGIAQVMSYLHSHDIIYCNLNLKSILLDKNFYPKLTNFEYSEFSSETSPNNPQFTSKFKDSLEYLAPEVLIEKKYSKSSDVYAFSIILYEILTKNKFNGNSTVLKSIKNGPIFKFIGISDFYKDLINRCSSYEPNERPTFDEIIEYIKKDSNITKSNDLKIYLDFVSNSKIDYFESTKKFNEFDEIIKMRIQSNSSNLLFDISDFKKQKKINRENYIDVYEIFNEKTDEKYSAKFYDIKIKKFYKNEIINHMREVNILSQLNHPSIRKFIDYKIIKQKPVLITEFLDCGSLSYLLKNKSSFRFWNDTLKLINIYGIAFAMSYLHSHNIIHRDLKPKNIFLDYNFFPKISNFLISKQFPPNLTSQKSPEIKGTPVYLAPEVFSNKEYSKSSDVYSFAMIVYEIITNKKPFAELVNVNQIIDEVVNKKRRPIIEVNVPKCYKDLIEKCWSQDPNERPTFDDVVNILKNDSNFITKNINKECYQKYIEFIGNSEISFNSAKQVNFDEISIESFESNELHMDLVDIFTTQTNNCIVDFDYFDHKNFEMKQLIGTGLTGCVRIVRDKRTENNYAAKIFFSKIKELTMNDAKLIFRSINSIAQANHPCLAQFIGYNPLNFQNKKEHIILYKYYLNGALEDIFRGKNKGLIPKEWTPTKKIIFIYGIAAGMSFLHSHDIIHGNLHPYNILLDEFLHPKIHDFGYLYEYSNLFNKTMEADAINQRELYHSPEVISMGKFTKSSDVYAYSMIIYQVLTSLEPFQNSFEKLSMFQKLKRIVDGCRPFFPDNFPDCYKELLSKCWAHDPNDRPSFDEIVNLFENDERFHTDYETIDEEEFNEYINYIKQYKISFDFDHLKSNKSNLYSFKKIIINLHKNDEKIVKELSVNVKPIDIQKFERLNKVGEGSFGIVYRIKEKETSKFYAAKVSKDSLLFIDNEKIKNLQREINIISILNYPSIMKFIGYSHKNFKNKPNPTIVTEFVSNISLKVILDLEKKGCGISRWDDTKKLINIYGISSAMAYLHSLNILHRDLKPDNILIDDNLYPKICDFGLSKKLSEKVETDSNQIMSNFKGTIAYSALEVLECKYSKAGDVYAFAIIVYEIITNEELFVDMHNVYQVYSALKNGYRPEFRFEIPKCYRKLIEDCWSENPCDRPSFENIVKTLKNDSNFITENVDMGEFLNYIDFLESKGQSIEKSNSLESKNKNQQVTFNFNNFNDEVEKENQQIKEGFLNLDKFELSESIGKSSLYKQYKVILKETNEIFLAKISMIKINKFSRDELISLRREVNIISQLNHPSFLKFIGYSPIDFKNQRRPVIITEMPLNGSLSKILELERKNIKIPGWDDTQKLINIYGIASAMSYLHINKIIHRDLRSDCVFLDDYLFPKISDFGLATKHHTFSSMTFQSSSGVKGTPIYLAPEVLQSNEYTEKSDVYSFALIVYEIIVHNTPFNGITSLNQIINEVVTKNTRPMIDQSVSESYKKLIKDCWSQNPKERPSFSNILYRLRKNSSFITEKVRKNDYFNYVNFVEESIKEFQSNKKILCIDEYIKMKNKIIENEIDEQVNTTEEDDDEIEDSSESSETSNYSSYEDCDEKSDDSSSNKKEQKNLSESESKLNNFNEKNSKSNEIEKEKADSYDINESLTLKKVEDQINNNNEKVERQINEEIEDQLNINVKSNDLEKIINECISSDNPSLLMDYLNENCDDETASDVFNRFYYSFPNFYIKLCEEGIKLNNTVSHHKYALSLMLDKTKRSKQSKIEARKHLEISIKNGYKMSYFLLGRLLHEYFSDDKQAFQIVYEGSLKGEKYSQCLLGHFISKGIGTKKDFRKGIEMILSSQANDFIEIYANDIGLYHLKVTENYTESFKWFECAFNMNKTKATINNYGLCFLKGIGVSTNIQKAKEIFTIGIQNNDANSKYHMAYILEKSDPELSDEYYKQSANEGNAHAKIKYAMNVSKNDKNKY